MKKYFLLSILAAAALYSCNETQDPFQKYNQAPVVEIRSPYTKDFASFSIDSIKLGKTYSLEYRVTDEQKGLSLTPPNFGNWKLEQSGNFENVTPSAEGEATLSLSATDCYGLTGQKSVKLVCFNNLPPVAKASCDVIAIISPLERKINAMSSYDRDQKYGGKIIAYEFTITGNKPVINATGFMMYIFPKTGSYRVKVRVQDSDSVWSGDYYFDAIVE